MLAAEIRSTSCARGNTSGTYADSRVRIESTTGADSQPCPDQHCRQGHAAAAPDHCNVISAASVTVVVDASFVSTYRGRCGVRCSSISSKAFSESVMPLALHRQLAIPDSHSIDPQHRPAVLAPVCAELLHGLQRTVNIDAMHPGGLWRGWAARATRVWCVV